VNHDISNVVFYLTNGESLVGVKLNYASTLSIINYQQPMSLYDDVENAVNAGSQLDGYEVVGYSIKAGREIHNFGDTYQEEFGNTGGDPALASGTYDGMVNISPTEIDGLVPIDLPLEPAMLSADEILDSTAIDEGADKSGDGDRTTTDDVSTTRDAGENVVSDVSGDSEFAGVEGADVFKWTLAEPGAHDAISNFDMNEPASGGDVLDLRDLLPPESADSLDSYLHFEQSDTGGTLVRISTAGEFTGDAAHDAGVAYQTIELQNVDLLSLGSDQQIIDNLINHGKLITE
jgi:hypothetical protein